MNTPSRYYNLTLAYQLEELLNSTYVPGPVCEHCGQNDNSQYDLTGYVIDDEQGVFVEKKCKKCGSVREDGDGDFYNSYQFVNGCIVRVNEDEKECI